MAKAQKGSSFEEAFFNAKRRICDEVEAMTQIADLKFSLHLLVEFSVQGCD